MGYFKPAALNLLRTLILVSLTALGIAFTLDQTLLNPYLLMTEFNRLDLSSVVEEMMSQVLLEKPQAIA